VVLAAVVGAHDLFLKLDSYFFQPNSKVTVRLLNGSFRVSENPVARDRLVDVGIVDGAGSRANPTLRAGGTWSRRLCSICKLARATDVFLERAEVLSAQDGQEIR